MTAGKIIVESKGRIEETIPLTNIKTRDAVLVNPYDWKGRTTIIMNWSIAISSVEAVESSAENTRKNDATLHSTDLFQ